MLGTSLFGFVLLLQWPRVARFCFILMMSSQGVFFEQCCARHYNCGSHEAVLK